MPISPYSSLSLLFPHTPPTLFTSFPNLNTLILALFIHLFPPHLPYLPLFHPPLLSLPPPPYPSGRSSCVWDFCCLFFFAPSSQVSLLGGTSHLFFYDSVWVFQSPSRARCFVPCGGVRSLDTYGPARSLSVTGNVLIFSCVSRAPHGRLPSVPSCWAHCPTIQVSYSTS